ncbi:hypothetical protein [Edaphobacter aggregans]|uniref:hypothetical protein n=1 Tax=Edaphobacter aggregans TaxID=570835 RepID=UPI00068EBED9|nr:hypothetical protein [Edaphobacter aggregans]
MATSVLSPLRIPQEQSAEQRSRKERRFAALLVTGLTAAALVVHGYHPFAEDGGLYMAGIKRVLNPALYPYGAEFVLGHLRFSLFAPAVAAVVRCSGMRLEVVLLAIYLASTWLTLAAGWMLASRCFDGLRERVGAVVLLAAWLPLSIAGTSLMLMDPYVTARSISTPCVLLALVGVLDFLRSVQLRERWRWGRLALAMVAFAVAAAMHPLMAAYGFGCALALGLTLPERRGVRMAVALGLCCAAVMVAAVLQTVAQPESAAYHGVAMSRYYWFLSQWQWYEWIGLAAPLAILAGAAWQERGRGDSARAALTLMALVTGSIAIVIAVVFARAESATHIVARLQPLRIFQQVYIVMILFVGAALARWLGRRTLLWAGVFGLLAAIMWTVDRQTFPASAHLELPSLSGAEPPANAWVQAFEWIRASTPVNAVFALDSDYITKAGEDAQCFRAIAERSVLPDYSKDGGEAAITPSLTAAWAAGQSAQARLSEESDAERLAALVPEGAEWVVLERGAATSFACDYANAAVKVCRLPGVEPAGGVRLSLRSQPASQPMQPATR